jgi:hypothetical protein
MSHEDVRDIIALAILLYLSWRATEIAGYSHGILLILQKVTRQPFTPESDLEDGSE